MSRFTVSALLLLSLPLTLFAQDTRQATKGDCSPAINNVKGNVFINCPGVAPRATKHLNMRLRKIRGLEAKLAEANGWKERYQDLETRLAAEGENRVLAQQARKLLEKGDLDAAARLFDRVIEQQNKELGDLAENLFNRAQIASLQFRPTEALGFLAQAYKYKPDNPQYAHEYALVLLHEGRWDEAERVLVTQIQILQQKEATENSSEYLAKALNNLGTLQIDTLRFGDAVRSFSEAEGIYRRLVQFNRSKFLPYLAAALGNKAAVEAKTFNFRDAEANFAECIQILESLTGGSAANTGQVAEEKEKTVRDLLTALNNITFLQIQEKNASKAAEFNTRALALARELMEANPRTYEEVLVQTLQNASAVSAALGKLDASEKMTAEGLEHVRRMATDDHDAYDGLLARSVSVSCDLARIRGRLAEAVAACKEALDLYTRLRERDSRGYGAGQSITLITMAQVHLALGKPAEAKTYYDQALSVEREVAARAPAAEQLQFANVLHDSVLYDLTTGQFDSARERLKEAVPLLRSLGAKYPDLMPLLGESLNTLGALELAAKMLNLAVLDLTEAERVEAPLAEENIRQFGPMLAMTYQNLGSYCQLKENNTEAEAYYQKTLNVYKRLAAFDSNVYPLVLKSLFTLSVLYRTEKKWSRAIETSNEGVSIARAQPVTPFNKILLAEQLENLAAAEIGAGNLVEAVHPLREGIGAYREAATDPSYKDLTARSMFVMSTAMADKRLRCEFLQRAREMLGEPALPKAMVESVQACN